MEIVIVSISLIMFMCLRMFNIEIYLIYYLIFRVCEGALGLGILVQIIRYYGRDLYYGLNIRKF